MICYFDTSAFVPLVVDEPRSPKSALLWEKADSRVSSCLLYAEAAAALAQAERMGRLSTAEYLQARGLFLDLWEEVNALEIDQDLIERAADLAREFGLRGYDAVHCASAELFVNDELVVASGDKRLLQACEGLGLATGDTRG